jgi:hypothetical protein
MENQEVAMARAIKSVGLRLTRWFKDFAAKNRPPHRWYEHDHFGV